MSDGAWYELMDGRRRWLTPSMVADRDDVRRRLNGAPAVPSSPAAERETAVIETDELELKSDEEEDESDGDGD